MHIDIGMHMHMPVQMHGSTSTHIQEQDVHITTTNAHVLLAIHVGACVLAITLSPLLLLLQMGVVVCTTVVCGEEPDGGV